ncbi:MAG: hypothetical protein AB1424_05835 [Thermodesulfobacteriota bacterium]
MAKFGTGELYATGLLYGIDPQYLLNVGNIPSTAALGISTVNPGPVTINGVGNIPAAEAWGTPSIFWIPQKLALDIDIPKLAHGINIRRLSAVPLFHRLQVTPNG